MINFFSMRSKKCILFFTLCYLFAGCIHKKSFKKLPPFHQANTIIADDLTVYAHAYTVHDSKTFFGTNLLLYGYQPIQFNIVNNTSKSFFIRPGYIDRPLIPADTIVPFIKIDSSLFVYSAGLPSFLLYWPLLPLFVAPVGYMIYKDNKEIKKLLREHTIEEQDTIEIKPYSSVEKLIFVLTQGKPEVTLKFYHQTEGALKSYSFNGTDQLS